MSRFLPLHRRLILAFTFIILLMVVLTGIISSVMTANRFEALMVEQGVADAQKLAPALENYYEMNSEWEGLADYLTHPEESRYEISMSDEMTTLIHMMIHDHHILVTDVQGKVYYDGIADNAEELIGGDDLSRGVPLYGGDSGELIGYVLVASDLGIYNEQQAGFLDGLTRSLLLSGALVGVVALVVAAAIASEIAAPVAALTVAAQELADGQTTEPLPVETDDELGQMSIAFNQMAEGLRRQQELRKQLVNNLAHELGTPLSVIQLEMKALRAGQATVPYTYNRVEREIDLLRNLVNDLDLLTANDAQIQLQLEPLELTFLVRRAVARWQPQATSRDIGLTFSEPSQTLPFIKADISRIIQVLGNLINNALRHTDSGGYVKVSCQIISLKDIDMHETFMPSDDAYDQPWLVTLISDSGEGIPTESVPYVFDRFFRTDETRNRHAGRGLGLSIVKQIIEAHEGYVWVHSLWGEGSTFGFCLPLDSVTEPPESLVP